MTTPPEPAVTPEVTVRGRVTTPTEAPLAYTILSVAALLQVGRSTVCELIRTGELPAIKIRRTRRVTRAALETYLERRGTP